MPKIKYKIPKDKKLYTQYGNSNGDIKYIMCRNIFLTGNKNWFLYSVGESGILELKDKGDNPLSLEERNDIFESND